VNEVYGTTAPITMSPHEAADALVAVDRSRAAVQRRSRWTARYMGAYGVATLVAFPAMSLCRGTVVAVCASCLWTLIVLGSAWYVRCQRVVGRGFRRVYTLTFGSWAVLWGVGLTLGQRLFETRSQYWVCACLIVAVPQFVGAWVTARR
jgi:hypothetical protein